MRYVIGFLSGVLGMLAGWAGLAFLVVSLAGEDRDGGIAMGAVFQIGPIGGFIGFIAGVWLFWKFGIARTQTLPASEVKEPETSVAPSVSEPPPIRSRISKPFSGAVVLIAAFIAWQVWYEFIRSPYLTHGYMTLDLQFRFSPTTVLPTVADDVHLDVTEGGSRHAIVTLGNAWRGHDGDRPGILARASLSYKAGERLVILEMPDMPQQTWKLDLASDPDPTAGFSDWRKPIGATDSNIEMAYSLSADR